MPSSPFRLYVADFKRWKLPFRLYAADSERWKLPFRLYMAGHNGQKPLWGGVHFPQFNALYQRGTKSPRNVTHLDEAGDVLLGYFNTIIYYATSEKLLWVRLFNLKNLYQQAVGNSSNTWNPAGDLRGPHPARLHPSRAIRHPSLTGT